MLPSPHGLTDSEGKGSADPGSGTRPRCRSLSMGSQRNGPQREIVSRNSAVLLTWISTRRLPHPARAIRCRAGKISGAKRLTGQVTFAIDRCRHSAVEGSPKNPGSHGINVLKSSMKRRCPPLMMTNSGARPGSNSGDSRFFLHEAEPEGRRSEVAAVGEILSIRRDPDLRSKGAASGNFDLQHDAVGIIRIRIPVFRRMQRREFR